MADITNKNELKRRIELFLDELDYSINESFCKETMKMMREFIGHASHRLDCEDSRVKSLKKKLKEYKDLEKQGLLLRLPLKIGDTVYAVTRDFISEYTICSIEVYNEGLFFNWKCEKGIYINVRGFTEYDIGKTVFLTKSEAEQKLKEMESDCIDKLDTDENNEDIIYEANCPKCNYDMFEIYDRVCKGGKSKYCKITNIHSSSCGNFYGTDWDVECICPKCKTKFTFSDEDYETFGLKFNDGLSVKE